MSAIGTPSVNAALPAHQMPVREDRFLLGSRSIRRDLRRHVRVLADFVHGARVLADDHGTSVDTRQDWFDAMDADLTGGDESDDEAGPAQRMRKTCEETGVPIDHGRHLLQAFSKRAAGRAMSSWGELLTTCQFSAAPIGRFLLDLHGEGKGAYRPAEALCTAQQVLVHLQTCGEDYRRHGRVVLPSDWLRQAGAQVEELGARSTSHGVRIVMDRMLDRVGRLLAAAEPLPELIADPGLRRELTVAHAEAEHLARKLRRHDPLRRRVALGIVARFVCRLRARKRIRRAASAR